MGIAWFASTLEGVRATMGAEGGGVPDSDIRAPDATAHALSAKRRYGPRHMFLAHRSCPCGGAKN